jgi:hypothetical protein
MLKWESQPRARSAASAASWPMVADAAMVGGEIHARREAARVHPISDGVAAAGPRAAIPARLSSGGSSRASLAAGRRPYGNNSARQFATVGSRGPYPGMLVGVSGSDVYDHQLRQIDHTTTMGRQRLSQSAAPMPTGILGGLRRVSLLGVGYHGGDARHRESRARVCARWTRSLKYRRFSSPDSCFSAVRDVPHLRASPDRCGRRS